MGVRDFITKVVEDTSDSQNTDGSKKSKKLYSSITSAARVWKLRISKGILDDYMQRESYDYGKDV